MKYSEAKPGRTFVIRLEDGDILHESIESFALEKDIKAAALIVLGGADKESKLIVGPKEGRSEKIVPLEQLLAEVNEVTGTGTIFPDEEGSPTLHMHIACGHEDKTVTGCVRRGVKVWHIMEVVLWELTGSTAVRRLEENLVFKLLHP